MSSFRSEPFLWIHLAGIATLPLWLELVWLGLAIGVPLPFSWLELLVVGAIGIVPVLVMQLIRPFDIFSILVVSLKPEQLTTEQRQILTLFKTNKQKLLSLGVAALMVFVLWQLYRLAPLAAGAASIAPQWRILGLLLATSTFLASNLFLQVPVSVLGVLTNSKQQFAVTDPYPLEKIEKEFTIPGLKVKQILPFTISKSTTEKSA
ncbi:low-complexity tail membrane protein [Pleurocapsales cyanobacterium LEGE 06147]|nr:low-complexity tail membrane protein [Pleurocapsales cyanobacterium LEGE 06147]